MMKQFEHGILGASVREVCELRWVLLEAGSCEKSKQDTLEGGGSGGDGAEAVLYFWGKFKDAFRRRGTWQVPKTIEKAS